MDLDRIYASVVRSAPFRGPSWFDRFEQSIVSLAIFPERCPAEPTLTSKGRTVRMLLFGKRRNQYRVYFTISDSDNSVNVLHVRHCARKEPKRV